MLQKFNLLLLALIILLCRSFTTSWPSEFREMVAWNFLSERLASKHEEVRPSSGDERYALAIKEWGPEGFESGLPLTLPSLLQVNLPADFAGHKFVRFNVRLILLADQGNFHFSVRNSQKVELCQIEMDSQGKLWVSDRSRGLNSREQVGEIALKSNPMELLVGLNFESSVLLIKVDGMPCRPTHLHSLESEQLNPANIGQISLGFSAANPSESSPRQLPGQLLHFAIEEGKS